MDGAGGGVTCGDKQAPLTGIPELQRLYPHLKTHEDLYRFSIEHSDQFWAPLARSYLHWDKPFDTVSDCDMTRGQIRWFLGGKLNASVNCLDRHLLSNGDKVALIWEKDEPGTQQKVTYKQLHEQVCRIANLLLSHGVGVGDCVAIYMPNSPIAAAVMLACTRIGAIHSVVFAGFSADSLANRIQDAGAKVLFTCDQAVRGGKIIELKKIADQAVAQCPQVKTVFVAKRTGAPISQNATDICLEKAMSESSVECDPVSLSADHLMYILYTSGSTGKPKGLAHSLAGYLFYTMFAIKQVFDYKPERDVFACVADIGWITGHSYVVYGPLACGGTAVMFESTPTYPDPGRYWEMVQRLRPTHFYGAPTALRLLIKYGDSWVTRYDRSSLRVLGCVGEPLNHEAWHWYHDVIGEKRCDVVDTWWQTETGGVCLSPRPSARGAEIIPGMPMRPMYGIEPVLLDDKSGVVSGEDVSGALFLRRPWPGMATTIYGDHDRFVQTYFSQVPGLYCTGDGAHRHPGGYYQITGRLDDVINVTGHRLGTAEVEDVIDEHPSIAESAVVGFPHEAKGEGVFAFVIMKSDANQPDYDEVCEHVRAEVRRKLAKYAVPDHILVVPGLPKTRSGKIMRRVLKKIAAGKSDELGDITTLQDPAVVHEIVNLHKQMVV